MAIDIGSWYTKYGPMVIRRCRSMLRNEDEAMDAVQDVFLNLIKAEKKLEGNFPSSLLYTMATNVCLNRLKVKRREAPDFSIELSPDVFAVVDRGFEQIDAEMLIKEILKDESDKTRTVLFMYYLDGMGLREIAEATGLSVSGAKKRMDVFKKRARLKLI